MRTIASILPCFIWACHGRRIIPGLPWPKSQKTPEANNDFLSPPPPVARRWSSGKPIVDDKYSPVKALAKLISSPKPSAFNPSSPLHRGVHFSRDHSNRGASATQVRGVSMQAPAAGVTLEEDAGPSDAAPDLQAASNLMAKSFYLAEVAVNNSEHFSREERSQMMELDSVITTLQARLYEKGLTQDEFRVLGRCCEQRNGIIEQVMARVQQAKSESKQPDPFSLPTENAISGLAEAFGAKVTAQEVAVGSGIFVLIHIICVQVANSLGYSLTSLEDDAAGTVSALVRFTSASVFTLFMSKFSVLPPSEWLGFEKPKPESEEGDHVGESESMGQALSPLASPLIAAAIFAPLLLFTVALGDATGIDLLPGRPWPGFGRSLDYLVAAPLTEELFFRAWLLAHMKKAGASDALGIGVTTILWQLWHLRQGISVNFLWLGACLSATYLNFGGSWALTAGSHAFFNLYVFILKASRATL